MRERESNLQEASSIQRRIAESTKKRINPRQRGREASAALFDESGKFASSGSSQPYGGEREGGSIL